MKLLLFFSILSVLLSSCVGGHNKELPVLDLEAAMNSGPQLSDNFTLNDIIDLVDIIPIETRPDALIGSATIVRIGRDFYYVVHNDKISRIDHNGKIVNTIARQGRGPGEYISIGLVDVNDSASTIRVFDWRSDKYITYDMNGTPLDEGSLQEKGVGQPLFISDDYMVMRGSSKGTYRLYITDRDMNILQGLFPLDSTILDSDRHWLTQLVGDGSDGNAALVNITTEDTLYRVTKRGISPEMILHKGQYRRAATPIDQVLSFDSPVTFTQTRINSFGDYYFIRQMILGFILEIWDKANGKLIAHSDIRDGLDQYGFRFVFPSGGETRVSSFHFDGDTIAFIVDAVQAVGAIEGLQEADNPVIVVATLKK